MENELTQRLDRIERLTLLAAKSVFSVKDLAFYLGLSPKTIYNRINSIPHYKGQAGIHFKKDEIEAWLCGEQHTKTIQI